MVLVNTPTDLYPETGRRERYTTIPPLGLGYVANEAGKYLGREQVRLIDAEYLGLSPRSTVNLILAEQPEFAGFTVTAPNQSLVYETASELIRRNKRIGLLLGGPQVMAAPELVMAELEDYGLKDNLVFLVTGEGEYPMRDFLAGRSLDEIPGIAYYAAGRPVIKAPVYVDQDYLDDNHPGRLYFENDPNYEGDKTESYILSSRGCPYFCAYCSISGTTKRPLTRPRKIGSIREDLTAALDQGINYIRWVDDLFLSNADRTRQLTELFFDLGLDKSGFGYEANGRANIMAYLPDALWDALRDTGLKELEIGVESGSPKILAAMNKGITRDQVLRTAVRALSRGIRFKGFLMAGYPGETAQDLEQTHGLSKELKEMGGPLVRFSMVPTKDYPGTDLFREVKKLKESLSRQGWAFGPNINVDLARYYPTTDQNDKIILQARTRYNAMPSVITGDVLQPLSLSEISGGASTGQVIDLMARIALLSFKDL